MNSAMGPAKWNTNAEMLLRKLKNAATQMHTWCDTNYKSFVVCSTIIDILSIAY